MDNQKNPGLTSTRSEPDSRPAPVPSLLTDPYWTAAASYTMEIQQCETCRRFTHPPRTACGVCGGSALGFTPVSGRGTVESFSVVHRSFAPGFSSRTPYVIAWIELEEQPGLRVFTNIVDTEPEDISINMPVAVAFTHVEEFGAIPVFRPAGR